MVFISIFLKVKELKKTKKSQERQLASHGENIKEVEGLQIKVCELQSIIDLKESEAKIPPPEIEILKKQVQDLEVSFVFCLQHNTWLKV